MEVSRRRLVKTGLVTAGILAAPTRGSIRAQTPLTPPTNGVLANPLDALDGEKIRAVINGERVVVRLIGCDAPEPERAENTTECGYVESRQALADAVVGRTLLLEADVEDKDNKDRLWRHVWLVNADGTDGGLLNQQLLQHGWVTTQEEEKNKKYADVYAAAASEAKTNKPGVLAVCTGFHDEKNRRGGHDDPAGVGEVIQVKGVQAVLNSYYFSWADAVGLAPTGGYKFVILNFTFTNVRETGKFNYTWTDIAGKDLDTGADYDNPDMIYLGGGAESAELSPGEYAIVESAVEVQETATNIRVKYTVEGDYALYWLTPVY